MRRFKEKDSRSFVLESHMPKKGGIPIAKSTGQPDRRYATDGRHGGARGGGIPIAKSTGLPDRRFF